MAYTTIDDPTLYFEVLTWSGDGNNTRNITGLDFQPDLSWKKERNYAFSIGNMWYDSVRGLGVDKHLNSVSTAVEGDGNDGTYGYYTGFISGGFSVIGGSSDLDYVNKSGHNYVAWNWLGGGSASSNSDGDITSSISANITSGFSIVSYTGSGTIGNTVGHGLGVIPAWIITKNRDAASQWITWHQGGTSTKNTDLSTAEAEYDSSSSGWQQGINNVPTSSVLRFTGGSHGNNNVMDSSEKYISYVWAEKQGFSKFGKYEGNGNNNGTFIYTGFRPAWVMIKKTSGTGNWGINDTKRDINSTYGNDASLYANTNSAETTSSSLNIDLLSNGMKLRSDNSSYNGSDGTYIYMAFAESPFVNSNGVPTNAR